ncbi:MAG: hypothetical protein M1836_006849 [Candelina mexicana]|nr:MAG: hypothetical protein M1836_006849 [Candelina mexicana]
MPTRTISKTSAAPSRALQGITLYRQDDPKEFKTLASKAFNEHEGVILHYEDVVIEAESVWKHLLIPGAAYAISFYRQINVAIVFPSSYITKEWLTSIPSTLSVPELRRMIYLHMEKVDKPASGENIRLSYRGGPMLDGCNLPLFIERAGGRLDVKIVIVAPHKKERVLSFEDVEIDVCEPAGIAGGNA